MLQQWIAALMSAAMFAAGSGTTQTAQPVAPVTLPQAITADDWQARLARAEENPASADYITARTAFDSRMGTVFLADDGENACISPESLYHALAMLAQGATGQTKSQMLDVLGLPDAETLAAECRKAFLRTCIDDEASRVRIAGSVWVQKGQTLHLNFASTLAQDFYAETFAIDFQNPDDAARIGQWIAGQTEGLLAPSLTPEPDTLLSLVNTVYYRSPWLDTFQADDTHAGTFHTEDGTVTADFMHRLDQGTIVRGDGWTRASLQLMEGSMVFVLPDAGNSVSALLKNPQTLDDALHGGTKTTAQIDWLVPRFSFGTTCDLIDGLRTLGMTDALDVQNADFSSLFADGIGAYLAQAIQGTKISVEEEGVEGAAYTVLTMQATSALVQEPERVDFHLDRPFLFAVTLDQGTCLFLGVLANPTQG